MFFLESDAWQRGLVCVPRKALPLDELIGTWQRKHGNRSYLTTHLQGSHSGKVKIYWCQHLDNRDKQISVDLPIEARMKLDLSKPFCRKKP